MTPRTKKPKPTDTLYRVFRGGSWFIMRASDVRAASRRDGTPMYRYDLIGFRTAQSGCCQSRPAQK